MNRFFFIVLGFFILLPFQNFGQITLAANQSFNRSFIRHPLKHSSSYSQLRLRMPLYAKTKSPPKNSQDVFSSMCDVSKIHYDGFLGTCEDMREVYMGCLQDTAKNLISIYPNGPKSWPVVKNKYIPTAEKKFRQCKVLENLDLNVSASGTYKNIRTPDYAPYRVTDGTLKTYWASNADNRPVWITVPYSNVRWIQTVRVKWQTGGRYQILTSNDGVDFTLQVEDGAVDGQITENKLGPQGSGIRAKYIRIQAAGSGHTYRVINEIISF